MKKVGMILLSFLIIGTSYGEMDKQHRLVEILSKGRGNGSVEALASTMRELEVKKEEGANSHRRFMRKVSKVMGLSFAIFVGGFSFYWFRRDGCGDRPTALEEALFISLATYFPFSWILGKVAESSLGYGCTVVAKKIELDYRPKIEDQAEKVCDDLTNISSDEKDKFIRNLLHAYDKSLK